MQVKLPVLTETGDIYSPAEVMSGDPEGMEEGPSGCFSLWGNPPTSHRKLSCSITPLLRVTLI